MELKDKFVSLQTGMPVSMKEIMERASGLNFENMKEYTRNNTNACVLSNHLGQIIEIFPVLKEDIPFVDINLFKAKGWNLNINPPNGGKFTSLTNSFWNCECKKYNVHHKIVGRCPECNKDATVKQMANVEDILADQLDWDFIVKE